MGCLLHDWSELPCPFCQRDRYQAALVRIESRGGLYAQQLDADGGGLEVAALRDIARDALRVKDRDKSWQQMEREADADNAAGRYKEYDSMDAFIEDLDKEGDE